MAGIIDLLATAQPKSNGKLAEDVLKLLARNKAQTAGQGTTGGQTVESVPAMYDQYARAVDRQNNLLREQQEAMRKQREAQMNATIRANNQAADNSLKEAYIANMLSKRNLPQQLKALGIAGGASETTLADIDNTYMNNRFGIETNRNDANAQARLAYDNGVMGDYSDYLAKAYELQGGFADAIASGKLAGKTTTTQTPTAPDATGYTAKAMSFMNKIKGEPETNTGYDQLSVNLGNRTYSVPQLINMLAKQGMTDEQIERVLNAQGIK